MLPRRVKPCDNHYELKGPKSTRFGSDFTHPPQWSWPGRFGESGNYCLKSVVSRRMRALGAKKVQSDDGCCMRVGIPVHHGLITSSKDTHCGQTLGDSQQQQQTIAIKNKLLARSPLSTSRVLQQRIAGMHTVRHTSITIHHHSFETQQHPQQPTITPNPSPGLPGLMQKQASSHITHILALACTSKIRLQCGPGAHLLSLHKRHSREPGYSY